MKWILVVLCAGAVVIEAKPVEQEVKDVRSHDKDKVSKIIDKLAEAEKTHNVSQELAAVEQLLAAEKATGGVGGALSVLLDGINDIAGAAAKGAGNTVVGVGTSLDETLIKLGLLTGANTTA